MDVIKFPRHQRSGRATTSRRPYDLAKKMIRSHNRRQTLAAERRKLLESMNSLERLTQELEAIQRDLEHLRTAFRATRRKR
ncbi:MAG: hypothetical protein V3U98_05545 [Acidobacteriota bacterium]|nr:hypothetical protein [Acidobacteriota bacterium]